MKDKSLSTHEKSCFQMFFIWLFSLIVSVLVIQIYLKDNVYSYIRTNVTESNILPYAFFVLLFFFNAFILTKVFRRHMLIINDNKTGRVSACLLLTIFIILAAWCFIEEDGNNFFGSPDIITYHLHERTVLLFAAIIFLFSFAVFEITDPKKFSSEKNTVYYIMAVLIGVLFAYSMYMPNAFSTVFSAWHSNAYYTSVFNYMHGVPRSDIVSGIYGHYGLLLAPFVKLFGGTYKSFNIVMCIVAFIVYITAACTVIRLAKNPLIKIFGCFALAGVQLSLTFSVYYQAPVHRVSMHNSFISCIH